MGKRKWVERPVRLRKSRREELERLIKGREATARERVRARILLLSHAGWDRPSIAEATGSSTSTVGRVRRQYCQEGLAEALAEKARPGAPLKLTAKQEQEIVALVCTTPPKGFARWSVRLLTEEVIQRGISKPVSQERIRVVLRDHDLKPWREKNVVHSTP
jgi:transposase